MTEEDGEQIRISGKDARGGEIILNSKRRRAVFIGGLVLFVLFAFIGTLLTLA
ncbi:hypothetical protein ABVV53_14555 [Novosphingobium sp. RD2P27]|uniref:Peptide ABC transporter permease n=1 Tax=Novosphingobium kalidii TaxID=3230299 RepID=A0ABV2D465_9SPHN